jgi:hypothetical protein
VSDERPAEPSKYESTRRRLRSRRRDDLALDFFRQAETNLADAARVDRILFELGKCYNPVTDAPIVDLETRKRIVGFLRAGQAEDARRLLDEQLAAYSKWARQAPEGAE